MGVRGGVGGRWLLIKGVDGEVGKRWCVVGAVERIVVFDTLALLAEFLPLMTKSDGLSQPREAGKNDQIHRYEDDMIDSSSQQYAQRH